MRQWWQLCWRRRSGRWCHHQVLIMVQSDYVTALFRQRSWTIVVKWLGLGLGSSFWHFHLTQTKLLHINQLFFRQSCWHPSITDGMFSVTSTMMYHTHCWNTLQIKTLMADKLSIDVLCQVCLHESDSNSVTVHGVLVLWSWVWFATRSCDKTYIGRASQKLSKTALTCSCWSRQS